MIPPSLMSLLGMGGQPQNGLGAASLGGLNPALFAMLTSQNGGSPIPQQNMGAPGGGQGQGALPFMNMGAVNSPQGQSPLSGVNSLLGGQQGQQPGQAGGGIGQLGTLMSILDKQKNNQMNPMPSALPNSVSDFGAQSVPQLQDWVRSQQPWYQRLFGQNGSMSHLFGGGAPPSPGMPSMPSTGAFGGGFSGGGFGATGPYSGFSGSPGG